MHSREPAAESLLVMIIFLHFLPGESSAALPPRVLYFFFPLNTHIHVKGP